METANAMEWLNMDTPNSASLEKSMVKSDATTELSEILNTVL